MELQSFYRDTWAEINLDHIFYHVQSLINILPEEVKVFAVVKANAYGHGDVQVARTALSAGANFLAVATFDEALSLRQKGIKAPILILGATRPQDAALAAELDLTLTVFQLDWLKQANEELNKSKRLRIHLKIDTGMGRIGIKSGKEIEEIEEYISEHSAFYLEGTFTHFAQADSLDKTYYNQQLSTFEELLKSFKQRPEIVHSSNSAAALRYPEGYFNAVRFGISMYGLTPSLEIEPELPYPLKQAISLKTKLVHVKKIQKGEKVGYGSTYEASGEEWIGTLPIGYADGWIRKLQGQEVLVDGQRVPIVGRVCMDQTTIKLPSSLPVGTEVTLIGSQGAEYISVNEIAKKLETINYEVTCMVSNRVPRVYIQGGEIVEVSNGLIS
ncbi:alanine racemase [Niallia sp. Krafla_26]|uniref:alanine racemase n=1 Tax=Niallia sp. Krafla_26 TaxID=3064703 RepID=UPI003D173B79